MARINRGKFRGLKVKILQWCNDWVTVDGGTKAYSPTSLIYTKKELSKIISHENTGNLLFLYTPDWANLTFIKK